MMELSRVNCGYEAANCYCIKYSDNECLLVDPGDRADRVLAYLEQKNLKLTHILLTHGHFDHTGACKELREETGCKIAIGKGNEIMLRDPDYAGVTFFSLPNPQRYLFEPDMILNDGDILEFGELKIQVIGASGHTAGDVCYLIDDILITGDVLFEGNCGRCDLPGGSWERMQQSLAKLKALPGDYKVLSGHGPDTTLDRERKYNPYMR